MPIVIAETPDSQSGGSDDRIDVKYFCRGSSTRALVEAAVAATSATTLDGLLRGIIKVEPIAESIDENNEDLCFWLTTVPYVLPESADNPADIPEEGAFSFESAGQNTHITQSKTTVNSYGDSVIPDYKGAINVDSEGNVGGVDIIIPVFSFQETHDIAAATATPDWRNNTCATIVGTLNDAEFRGHGAGEVLLGGINGNRRGLSGPWRISFNFQVNKDATGLVVGDITDIVKAGWDYLWVLYEEFNDTAAKKVVKRPRAVYVEQVYDRDDFEKLAIGTDPI